MPCRAEEMADLPAAASTVRGLAGADGSGDEEPPLTGLWLGGLSTGSEETLLLPLQNDGPLGCVKVRVFYFVNVSW